MQDSTNVPRHWTVLTHSPSSEPALIVCDNGFSPALASLCGAPCLNPPVSLSRGRASYRNDWVSAQRVLGPGHGPPRPMLCMQVLV